MSTTTPTIDIEALLAPGKILTTLDSPETFVKIIEKISGSIYEQKSVEWYEMRSYTVGGSEIGHLVSSDGKYDNGFFKILLDRFCKEPFSASGRYNCDYGTFFEEVTRMVFEVEHNVRVLETGSIEGFCYPQRFSPDGLAIDGDGTPILCEFKTPVSREYVKGYISDLYFEQVYTGLLTFYQKYKIHAKGMFMDCFLKPAFLDQLRRNNRGCCFDEQRVWTGKNYNSIAEGQPIYIGVVEIVPKDKEVFISWMINSKNDFVPKQKSKGPIALDDDIVEEDSATNWIDKEDLVVPVENDGDCICEGDECVCPAGIFKTLVKEAEVEKISLRRRRLVATDGDVAVAMAPEEKAAVATSSYYVSDLGKKYKKSDLNDSVVDIQKIALFCDLLTYIYDTKNSRDEIRRQFITGAITEEECGNLLESLQDFEIVYHRLGDVAPTTPGFYIGYKVFKLNPVMIELELDELEEDIKYRTEVVAHTKTMMDLFNEYIEDCATVDCYPVFDRKEMKTWLKKAAKNSNDCRKVKLDSLEDALYDKIFNKVKRNKKDSNSNVTK